ncbi:MAG: type III-B CRISPR module RAMP protein Cmr4 [Parvularcula sp.]
MTPPLSVPIGMFAETPIHVGIGQVTSAIDLPVAREATTGYPVVPSSGMKGALRDKGRQAYPGEGSLDSKTVNDLFGTEKIGGEDDSAGSILINDAKILLLPVRSLSKPFSWVTCPFVLDRFARDMRRLGSDIAAPLSKVENYSPDKGQCITDGEEDTLYLEELFFESRKDADYISGVVEAIHPLFPQGASVSKDTLKARLTIVDSSAFNYLCTHTLPIRQRNKLDKNTKMVESGHLWTEEYVPPESVFYTMVADRFCPGATDHPTTRFKAMFKDTPYLQVGGKETIGCGWFQLSFPDGTDTEETG